MGASKSRTETMQGHGFKSANKAIMQATQGKLIVQKGHEKLCKARNVMALLWANPGSGDTRP